MFGAEFFEAAVDAEVLAFGVGATGLTAVGFRFILVDPFFDFYCACAIVEFVGYVGGLDGDGVDLTDECYLDFC